MRINLRSRPIGWITAFGTFAAMAATLVVAAPSGAAGEKTYETSFEANCVLAPGVLNQKGVIKVHQVGHGPATINDGGSFSLTNNTITVTTPKEWGESFFALGSRSVKGFVLSTIVDTTGATPARNNIAKPPEFPTGLPIKAKVENREVEFTVPSEGRTFVSGPYTVAGPGGEEVVATVDTAPGFKEVSAGHFEATGEGILSEETGFNEAGEANVGPIQTACTAPEHVVIAQIPIIFGTETQSSSSGTFGPCGLPTCTTESTSSSQPSPTTQTATSNTTACGGCDCSECVQINDRLTGSLTVHKLGQTINLPEGCTFRSVLGIPGPFEADTKCPPFTASLKLLGFLRASLGLNIVQSEPVKGTFTDREGGKLLIEATAKDNIEITSVGLLGITIPTSCKTAQPVVFPLHSENTPTELITTGATSSGETTLPAVQCGGLLGGVTGSLLTVLMSGPHNPYTLTIAP
jgi:hypothetical protein